MPITCSGLFVQLAIFVIEIEDVFEAKIALLFLTTLSRSLNTFSLAYSFSIIAYVICLLLQWQNHNLQDQKYSQNILICF